jgi:hypothetical protein
MSDSDRGYSEREFALILAKASELAKPRVAGAAAADRPGLTLEEMKAIASEVGLDPDLVARAARLVALDETPSAVERLMGGPMKYRIDAELPNGLNEARANRLLHVIRSAAEERGEGVTDTAGVSWNTVGEGSRVMVTAHAEGDGTRVRIVADRAGALALTTVFSGLATLMAGIVVLVAGKSGAYDSVLLGLTLFGGAGLGIAATARALWASSGRALRARVAALHDTIERTLGDEDDPGA